MLGLQGRYFMLITVMGGSGSGKSQYAEDLAVSLFHRLNADRLIYIAAMKPYGSEACLRIERHRRQRAGKGFETLECFCRLKELAVPKNGVMLLECVSNLAANEMFDEKNKNTAEDITEGIVRLAENSAAVIAVTNSIFSDGADCGSTTREYIKALARINNELAVFSDRVTEVVCGIPLDIKNVCKIGI